MSYQTPLTIKEALERIHRHNFVLPAIQREYVWKPAQIAKLFDSLMRGYPIGAFLFWEVDPERVAAYKFYDFVQNYHQRDNPHCPTLEVTQGKAVTGILDGQQRLTALNIGLRGTHASKEPRMWWNNPDAFPKKRLFLNLLSEAEENDDQLAYDFRFLTEQKSKERDESHFWFPVPKILEFAEIVDLNDYVVDNDLNHTKEPFRYLSRLFKVVHEDALIVYYQERSQDLDKVLNIFIRTNSGGTVLSYSDLLLSIATAQWSDLDARSAVFDLVDDLNSTRFGFSFSKDFVLKAGLMLSDIASVGFKVTNFDRANMAVLESRWAKIEQSLKTTVRLVAEFGFSGQTLGADSALLPIAYYIYHRGFGQGYLSSVAQASDRAAINGWLVRSLLKSGVWGSGLDTTLTALRAVIKLHGVHSFPVGDLETELARRGRSLAFGPDEVEDLLDAKYGDRRTFALLSVLFPFVNLGNEFHVDHIFPKSRFTPARLRKAGFPEEKITELRDKVNRLGNLQLLAGGVNQSKNDKMPLDWLEQQFPTAESRSGYVQDHLLGQVPSEISGFESFYDVRREGLLQRLTEALSQSTSHAKED